MRFVILENSSLTRLFVWGKLANQHFSTRKNVTAKDLGAHLHNFVQFSCTKWTYNCLALPGNTVLSVWQAFPDSASSNLCLRKHFDVYELKWSRSDRCKAWRSISNNDLKLDNIQREHLSFVWKKKLTKLLFTIRVVNIDNRRLKTTFKFQLTFPS